MRIAIASTYVPFLSGGGTKIVDDLAVALAGAGHLVDTIRIPMFSYWPHIPEQTLALRLLDLTESCGNAIDRLITVRYPAYAIPHPDKIAWFLHHHRGAYDLWGTQWSDMQDTPESRQVRGMMMKSDTTYLEEASKVYTISRNVANRLKSFNGFEPDGVIYPPLPLDHPFHPGEFGDYFVYCSRLCTPKRQALAIEAMRHCKSDCRLVLVGAPDVPEYLDHLHDLIRRYKVSDRVELIGWASERDMADLLAGSRGALFLPYDEDYGYATLEALHSGKPVITLTDSGGSLELIEDDFNGLVVEPDARAIAGAMDRLMGDRFGAMAMGRQALRTPADLGITWDHLIESFTS